MALLINGNGFSPVTAQEDADLYAGIVGNTLAVLNVGNNMSASIINSTTVRILDGEAISQGRRIHIDAGSYDDFTIPSGSQGITSYYIIGYRLYTNDDGDEVAATFVQATTQTGTITEEQLRDGAAEAYVSFYRVTVSGLTISSVTPMYSTYTPLGVTGIQHGVTSASYYSDGQTAGSYTVTFPYAMASVPTVVACYAEPGENINIGSTSLAVSDVTTTGFTFWIFDDNSASQEMTGPVKVAWIAIC